jgi:hypothetical protein
VRDEDLPLIRWQLGHRFTEALDQHVPIRCE